MAIQLLVSKVVESVCKLIKDKKFSMYTEHLTPSEASVGLELLVININCTGELLRGFHFSVAELVLC